MNERPLFDVSFLFRSLSGLTRKMGSETHAVEAAQTAAGHKYESVTAL